MTGGQEEDKSLEDRRWTVGGAPRARQVNSLQ